MRRDKNSAAGNHAAERSRKKAGVRTAVKARVHAAVKTRVRAAIIAGVFAAIKAGFRTVAALVLAAVLLAQPAAVSAAVPGVAGIETYRRSGITVKGPVPARESEAQAGSENASGQTTEGQNGTGAAAGQNTSGAAGGNSGAPAVDVTPLEEPVTMYTQDGVNVRAGAGTDTEVVGKLALGSEVTVTGTAGDWSAVKYDGGVGFIKSEFLSEEEPEVQTYQGNWDLSSLSNEVEDFGYSRSNLDENNVPTDWTWYENKWGQFNVDWIQDTGKKTIYLTMDEGFENDTTAGILDTLKAKNVKALFFLTKYFVDEMPDTVQRMIDEGHQLGNHSCTHPRMPELSVEEQQDQIMTLQNLVKDKFGYTMKYFRYPEGAFSAQSLGLVNNLGLKAVFWSYAYNDYSDEQPPVAESLEKAVDAVHPGAVYLLHASSTTNAAFLGDWIDACRAKGYEFGVYPADAN